jgi:hypothetical protein
MIAAARFLISPGVAVTDACLRRAVSTAYYALFHTVSEAAASCFIGSGQKYTVAYGLIYRSFDHARLKEVCEVLCKPVLPRKTRDHLKGRVISQDMKDFANDFPDIQEARHLADYDPQAVFVLSDVSDLIDVAERALAAFARTSPAERADILAFMMKRPRQ